MAKDGKETWTNATDRPFRAIEMISNLTRFYSLWIGSVPKQTFTLYQCKPNKKQTNGKHNLLLFKMQSSPSTFSKLSRAGMQRLLFENQLNDFHFSCKKTFFLQGTVEGLPFG